MNKTIVLLGMLATIAPTTANAQDRDRKYEVGMRSALIMGSMDLSGIDPAFDDLEFDGLEGPHMSGFFLLYRLRSNLRVGIETLVSNSDQTAPTTMNYQAAGPVAELSYGDTWFIAGGMHAGGLVVNVMAHPDAVPPEGASAGRFFKGEGAFVAPYADVGYRYRRGEIGLFVKQVNIFGEADRGGLTEFSSTFVGLRLAFGL